VDEDDVVSAWLSLPRTGATSVLRLVDTRTSAGVLVLTCQAAATKAAAGSAADQRQ
jgi:hypothetical protein